MPCEGIHTPFPTPADVNLLRSKGGDEKEKEENTSVPASGVAEEKKI